MFLIKDIIDNINLDYSNLNEINLEKIENILKQYNGLDWNKYINIDKSDYNKKLIYKNNNFELFIITWMPNNGSKIHDHSSNGCILKILKGSLTEKRYNNNLQHIKTNIIYKNNISFISNKICYHSINNNNKSISVSLHIYSPSNYIANIYN
jgi:cysteine dioxygenase